MVYTYGQLEQIWISAGGNPGAASVAAAIAMAESGGNPNATNVNTNGSIDRGLWQINSIHGSQSTFDPMGNARSAIAISNNGSNWAPWCTAWTNGCSGTLDPTSPNTPAGKYFALNAGAAPSGNFENAGNPSSGGGLLGGIFSGTIFDINTWYHFFDVIANWLFYSACIGGGISAAGIGIAIMLTETPAGKATFSAVKRGAKTAAKVAILK